MGLVTDVWFAMDCFLQAINEPEPRYGDEICPEGVNVDRRGGSVTPRGRRFVEHEVKMQPNIVHWVPNVTSSGCTTWGYLCQIICD